MRWEDERYVRVYTRDTVDWLGLSFIAQGLFCLILRKVDRAGLLKLGKQGKRGVAIVIGHAGDWARLEPALEELLADGCVQIRSETLIVPNFIEAQEATQSEAQRKRESRAKARDLAAAASVLNPDKPSQNVTECHKSGQIVPELSGGVRSGHNSSQLVTPNCAVPSRAEPDLSPPAKSQARQWPEKLTPLAALVKALEDGGWSADPPTKNGQRQTVGAIVDRDGVHVCAERLLAMVRAKRAAGQEPHSGLGWHLDTLNGAPLEGDRKAPPKNGTQRRAEAWDPIVEAPRRRFDPLTGKEIVS